MKKLGFISLGCAKNLVDSESILGRFLEAGWVLCEDVTEARLIVINACGFIEEARQEAREVIEEALLLRRGDSLPRIVVVGCLPQLFAQSFAEEYPEVDGWIGVVEPQMMSSLCERVLRGERVVVAGGERGFSRDTARLRLTPRHYAYLRIADGCDNRCAYCLVPLIRGEYRSKPLEQVLEEAEELVSDGTKELNIIAQDTTNYGQDIYGRRALLALLKKLLELGGYRWLRLLYTHPAHWENELIELIASEERICKYIDLPIQHISDRILRLMRRKVSRTQIESLIDRFRERIPDLAIRTSIIVGFPGETDGDFEELLDFIRRVRFERLGAFKYSPEQGTDACALPEQVPEELKQERFDELMSVQAEISRQRNASLVGSQVEVLLDGQNEEGVWTGRTQWDAPDVDGMVIIRGAGELQPGRFITVGITGSLEYDLIGYVEYT